MTRVKESVPRAVMYVYPWDLYDEGVDRALDSLASCGIDAVQLAFSYHIATFLHPRAPRRRVHYGEQGVLHFDPSVVRQWPFDPPVSREVTGPHYLSALLDAIAAHDMDAIAWVVYLYNHTLARAHPEFAVRNAYGDINGAQLCPANPAVRAYARTLTHAVVKHRPLAGFVCESLSYLPYDYGFLNPKMAVTPGPSARLLLGLCFCEHCRNAAREEGLDADALARQVRRAVDDHLARLPDGTRHEDGTEVWSRRTFGGELHAFLDVREGIAGSLQREVLGHAAEAGLRVGSTTAEDEDLRVSGVGVESLRSRLDELRVEIFPQMDTGTMRTRFAEARALVERDVPVYALVQLSHFSSEPEFCRALEAARRLGVERFRIYQYGLLTRRQMDWLRRARPLWSDGGRDERTMTRGRS